MKCSPTSPHPYNRDYVGDDGNANISNSSNEAYLASSINEISSDKFYQPVACGTIAINTTTLLVKNPNHPEPTFTKSICETVIERANLSVNKLKIKFKQLQLYRSTIDGECLHDRFAVYTDLNAPVTPVICGNQTGKSISIPFALPQTSLIVSITTSDLDHDRAWVIGIEQQE